MNLSGFRTKLFAGLLAIVSAPPVISPLSMGDFAGAALNAKGLIVAGGLFYLRAALDKVMKRLPQGSAEVR
ncbi:MAG: hypothetical protein A3G34_15235 [Candidatus Lindowbacteria bacterium RIFCSPLOWO2_12_FULL_62_27]|nr:MAG: hypothetical protein A3G34_15235 [Candidatus Lindowbacteria bacterium RIFCSPLOWO2_12_FULL_62_27]OGH63878.1 MAG: hypothetical protein A3I06_06215 [Candidatus Lindowbacteria bacterium RIFCSPLOWO2_02_FULL_62_12]